MELAYLLVALVGFFLIFAQMQLFKISDTLVEIREELRQNYWLRQLHSERPEDRQHAVANLCAILSHRTLPRESMVVSALCRCGPDAKAAVPALKELLLNDENEQLGLQAGEAIKEIDPAEFALLIKAQDKLGANSQKH